MITASNTPSFHYSQEEVKKFCRESPLVDRLNFFPVGRKKEELKPPQLSPFFQRLIEKKVNKVAMMVIFHIIHFILTKFWSTYNAIYQKMNGDKKNREDQQKKAREHTIADFKDKQKLFQREVPRRTEKALGRSLSFSCR